MKMNCGIAAILGLLIQTGLMAAEGPAELCLQAQQVVENYDESILQEVAFDVTHYTELSDFTASKPKIDDQTVRMGSYLGSTDTVPQQLWCKFKNQEAIKRSLGIEPAGSPASCGLMNERIVNASLAAMDNDTQKLFASSPLTIAYGKDQRLSRGDQWVKSQVLITEQDQKLVVQATTLRTANWIPVVGGMRYCKLLSPLGAETLIGQVISANGLQQDFLEEQLLENQVKQVSTQFGEDAVDIYFPAVTEKDLTAAVFIQGGKVDKKYYSDFAAKLAKSGFVVAVPARDSFFGKNMTQQIVLNETWDGLRSLNADGRSPLFQRIRTDKLALMGHSLGGLSSLRIMAEACSLPTCRGSYEAPAELAAVMVFGTNTRTPFIGNYAKIDTRNIPLMFIQGTQDGVAEYEYGVKTFEEKTKGDPQVFVTLEGANHFSIANINNPPKADADKKEPTIGRVDGIETIARWTAAFFQGHINNQLEGLDYVYDGVGDRLDDNVTVRIK